MRRLLAFSVLFALTIGAVPLVSSAAERAPGGSSVFSAKDNAEGQYFRAILRHQPVLSAANENPIDPELLQTAPSSRRLGPEARPADLAKIKLARQLNSRLQGNLRSAAEQAEAERGKIAAIVRTAGGRVLASEEAPSALFVKGDQDVFERLQAEPRIEAVEAATRAVPQLQAAAGSIGAPDAWAAGLNGSGGQVKVGISSERLDSSHPTAWQGLDLDQESAGVGSDHGTHTAGLIASQHSTHRGIAYGVDGLISGSSINYLTGLSGNDGADIVSRSFGSAVPNGDPDSGGDINLVPALLGITWVDAAGNNGPNLRTLGNDGRNTLLAAAYNDAGTASSSDDAIPYFSSRGPTLSGRKKPDLAAPGVQVRSPSAYWDDAPNPGVTCNAAFDPIDPDGTCPDYTDFTGTSASAPIVAASAAILYAAGVVDEKAQRALLVNSARPMGATSWDPAWGWGALDLKRAVSERGFSDSDAVTTNEARFYRVQQPAGGRATIVWNFRGLSGDQPFCSGSFCYTLSDLNLHQYRAGDMSEVTPPAGGLGGPDSLDPNDQTERAYAPEAGEFIYKVKAGDVVSPPTGDGEPFAFAASGPVEDIIEPAIDIAGFNDQSGACGEEMILTTRVSNPSDEISAEAVRASLIVPAGASIIEGPAEADLGLVEPGEERLLSWRLRVDQSVQVTLEARSQGLGEIFTRRKAANLDCEGPVALKLSPSVSPAEARCGTTRTLRVKLENPSSLFAAEDVAVSVSGQGANFSGEVEAATPSLAPGSNLTLDFPFSTGATAKIDATATASINGTVKVSETSVQVSCQTAQPQPPARQSFFLSAQPPILKRGWLYFDAHWAGPAAAIDVVFHRGRATVARERISTSGWFRTDLRPCKPGKWWAEFSFAGSNTIFPAWSKSATLRVSKKQITC